MKDVYNPGKGFAFVTFSTPGEAQAAIKVMYRTNMCGKDIRCSLACKRREETKTEKKLKMRLKEMEAEIEKFKYVLGVLRLAFVDLNISGNLRGKRKWTKITQGNNISVMKKYISVQFFKIFILNQV